MASESGLYFRLVCTWRAYCIEYMRFLKKFPLHPTFLLLLLWFLLAGRFPQFLIFSLVVCSHEFGHFIVAKKLGYQLNSFFLAPYGVSLNYEEKVFEPIDEIKIALAGPCTNFILSLFIVGLWWIFPISYAYSHVFVEQSVMLGLFNLLPAYPMDGGRMCVGFFNDRMPRKKAVKVTRIFNLIFSACFFLLFIFSCFQDFNPTFALAACFMLGGLMQSNFESKYEAMNIFKKKVKNYTKVSSFVIHSSETIGQVLKHIQTNKYVVFYVLFADGKTRTIDENTLLKLTLKHAYHETLEFALNKQKRS